MSPYNLFPGHSHQIVPRRSRARQTPRKSQGTKHGDGHTVIRGPPTVMVPRHMTNSVRDNNAWSNGEVESKVLFLGKVDYLPLPLHYWYSFSTFNS